MKVFQEKRYMCTLKQRVNSRCGRLAIVGLGLILITAISASAQAIYSSIPSPLPPSVESLGPEAYGFAELGDGLVFTPGTSRLLGGVSVVMVDWACQQGSWTVVAPGAGSCVTTPGSTFSQAITLNIFAVVPGTPPSPGALLATSTQTFQIPFRPSSDPVHCTDGQRWFSTADSACHYGLATPIRFDFTGLTLPDQVIIGIEFNTTTYGPHPLGTQPCSPNCPYDSLNISALGNPTVGSNVDPTSVFVNWSIPSYSCTSPSTGAFVEDPGNCGTNSYPYQNDMLPNWKGLHPEIEVDPQGDVFQLRYVSNLGVGDSVINISNDGQSSNGTVFSPGGNLCVGVYSFDENEELLSCCSCYITPNALVSLSAQNINATSLTGGTTSLVIKLLAFQGTTASACTGATISSTSTPLAPGLHAWGTTVHALPVAGYTVTETNFSPAALNALEYAHVTQFCEFNQINGSGKFGQCGGCAAGGE